jgi:hypothetical protein
VSLTATDGDVDATIAKREWDIDGDGFDDGTGSSIAPTFSTAGAKTVRFRVTDDGGAAVIASRAITITGGDTGGGSGGDGSGGDGGGGGGGQPVQDITAPHLTVTPAAGQKLKTVAAKGLKLTLGADEGCTVKLLLTIDKKTAKSLKLGKKALTVGTATATLVNGTTVVTVKLTSKARKAFKKAKKVKLSAKATGTDAAGNAATLTKSVSLKK